MSAVEANAAREPRGSVWRCWDPHIHTPGTGLNDQFRGPAAWESWLTAIESAEPNTEALGITDYWTVDNYEQVVAHRAAGRLPNVGLLFPNVELRLEVATVKGGPLNAHLLVSPDDADHFERLRSFLQSLSFSYGNERYGCSRESLIRLGRKHDPGANTDEKALEVGSTQFKISLDTLQKAFDDSEWARDNILLAVAAGSGDGASGLDRSSFAAFRRDLERRSVVIISGKPSDRAFWLGERALSAEELSKTYGGRKLCLHGSDAHSVDKVGKPDQGRFQWIKGDATFDSLRQACIEPGTRSWIGERPPGGALPHRIISDVRLDGAPWAADAHIPLNSGLIGIIGARGSGKTALADLIAAAAGCDELHENEASFLRRAADHLGDLRVELTWGDGEVASVTPAEHVPATGLPDAQYLSQQFVERLSSTDGELSDELLAEIERVIYDAHGDEARLGTTNFAELRELKTREHRLARQRSGKAISEAAALLNVERGKRRELGRLEAERVAAASNLESDRVARNQLTVVGGRARADRLAEVLAALQTRKQRLDGLERERLSLEAVTREVEAFETRGSGRERNRLQSQYPDIALTPEAWDVFRLRFEGDPVKVLRQRMATVVEELGTVAGPGAAAGADGPLPTDVDLGAVAMAVLQREASRLQAAIGLDQRKQDQLSKLNAAIASAEVAINRLDERITDASAAEGRMKEVRATWDLEYKQMFAAINAEEAELRTLYQPLEEALAEEDGLVQRLSFVVRRDVDVRAWAAQGEELLDLRKVGPFRGAGRLLEIAEETLGHAWRRGSAEDVAEVMAAFRTAHDAALFEHAPDYVTSGAAADEWGARMSEWLASVAHISIHYGIQYENIDIERLSPGTRGIVLLLLYLAIDRNDDRPLIIDQPEENLDPQSIFDELVERFRAVRERRQVIIVTHNANLIVNTDVDQVIVASAGPHRPGELPEITWRSGGLEEPEIRHDVCAILEGGEQAFIERARRLRVARAVGV